MEMIFFPQVLQAHTFLFRFPLIFSLSVFVIMDLIFSSNCSSTSMLTRAAEEESVLAIFESERFNGFVKMGVVLTRCFPSMTFFSGGIAVFLSSSGLLSVDKLVRPRSPNSSARPVYIGLAIVNKVNHINKILCLQHPHVNQWVWVLVPLQHLHEERTR